MVVGLSVAVTASCHSATVSIGKLAPVIAVPYRRSDVVAVSVVVAVVVVVVVVVVVDGFKTGMVMVPRIVVCPMVVRTVPAPAIVETIVIPIGRVVVWTVVVARPPPIVTHVNT